MIKAFQGEDLYKLVDEMNKFEKENNVFATNIFRPTDGLREYWYGVCFFHIQGTQKDNSHTDNAGSPKKLPASESQLNYIHKNNLDVNTENLSKQEAFLIIKQHKERK